MTPERFNDLARALLGHAEQTMTRKAKDYARTGDAQGDRLANFRRIAGMAGMEPTQVVVAYLLKQVEALAQAVSADPVEPRLSTEGVRERAGDVINYAILAVAVIEDAVARAEQRRDSVPVSPTEVEHIIHAVEVGNGIEAKAMLEGLLRNEQ